MAQVTELTDPQTPDAEALTATAIIEAASTAEGRGDKTVASSPHASAASAGSSAASGQSISSAAASILQESAQSIAQSKSGQSNSSAAAASTLLRGPQAAASSPSAAGDAAGDATGSESSSALVRMTRKLGRFASIGICIAAALWLVRLQMSRATLVIPWIDQLAVAAAVAATGVFLFMRERRQWAVPLRQLATVLPQVRAGVAPIEELGKFKGPFAAVASELQEAMRDLRRYKLEIQRVERDMNRRVAQRTDALERLLGSLRQQAARDALTTLYNRHMFEECLPQLMHRARADGEPLTLLLIDVDFFKQINDTLGHAAGDEFLRSLGQLMRSTVRGGDLPFRYGGDEFCIILPNTPITGAQPLIKRLSSLADALGKTLRVACPPRLSVGCSCLSDLAATATSHDLVEAADKDLYNFKIERKTRENLPISRVA